MEHRVLIFITLPYSMMKTDNSPFDTLIDSYILNKVGIDSNFLTQQLASGLFQHITQLKLADKMAAAGIGNDSVKDSYQQMRGDKIYWLDKKNENVFEQTFLLQIEAFIEYLNSTCYTGITGYEFHYAVYETGTVYKRHKDQFKNNASRKFSLINYLNEDWLNEEGGQLLVYQESHTESILPQSKTAVFFKSDEMEHEVTVAVRDRMSITGWLTA
jgi:SM-20-related protein